MEEASGRRGALTRKVNCRILNRGAKYMSNDEKVKIEEIRSSLQSFLDKFNEYGHEVLSDDREQERLDNIRSGLQRLEPEITSYISNILGDFQIAIPRPFAQPNYHSSRDILTVALLGGNNEEPLNFEPLDNVVKSILNKSIGNIDAGLWPPKEPNPILLIHDAELKSRCSDLLDAPGNYDRVIREATTVLEDRIRNKVGYDLLSRLIPSATDQCGERLVNTLFAPGKPIILYSEDSKIQNSFYKVLIGTIAYLRNPYHHRLDDYTEWSWAWSTVGFIDRLLAEVGDCAITEN